MTAPRPTRDADLTEPGVPPEAYTEEYFLSNCNGFQYYLASHGRDPAPRLRRALALARVQRGERVLDIGCGRGELLVQCALLGAHATGIDYAEAAVRLAAAAVAELEPALRDRVAVRQMDARRLEFADGAFDVVFMTDVVEHLYPEELDQAMAEVRRVLAPQGRLIVHTAPNGLFYGPVWRHYVRHVHRVVKLMAAAARVRSAGFRDLMFPTGQEPPRSPYELQMHVNEHSPGDLRRLLRRHGFRIRRMDYHDPDRGSYRASLPVRLLDTVRFLRPLSYYPPLDRLFSNHIWAVATPDA
ncbi:MAG TPA: class I SAM-dependent methyltransferase [Dehalococcoidia bacterium]